MSLIDKLRAERLIASITNSSKKPKKKFPILYVFSQSIDSIIYEKSKVKL